MNLYDRNKWSEIIFFIDVFVVIAVDELKSICRYLIREALLCVVFCDLDSSVDKSLPLSCSLPPGGVLAALTHVLFISSSLSLSSDSVKIRMSSCFFVTHLEFVHIPWWIEHIYMYICIVFIVISCFMLQYFRVFSPFVLPYLEVWYLNEVLFINL